MKADAQYTGRVTVPVLWDRKERTIGNNESRDVLRMLDVDFEPHAQRSISLYPAELAAAIEETIDAIYEPINNGVYRCGFAGGQPAYERAFERLFEALDHYDTVLSKQRYLCGPRLTEARGWTRRTGVTGSRAGLQTSCGPPGKTAIISAASVICSRIRSAIAAS
jgi:putative glutathione S-transferase